VSDGAQRAINSSVHSFGNADITRAVRLDWIGPGAPMIRRKVVRALVAGGGAAARELRRQDAVAPDLDVAETPSRRSVASLYWFFVAELGCLALAFFEVDLFLPHGWVLPYRVVLGLALLAGGLIFVPSRLGARSLVLERLIPSRPTRRRRWRRLLVDLILQLIGLAMLIGAALELARALSHRT
jgi:hypothetical protein